MPSFPICILYVYRRVGTLVKPNVVSYLILLAPQIINVWGEGKNAEGCSPRTCVNILSRNFVFVKICQIFVFVSPKFGVLNFLGVSAFGTPNFEYPAAPKLIPKKRKSGCIWIPLEYQNKAKFVSEQKKLQQDSKKDKYNLFLWLVRRMKTDRRTDPRD